MISRTLLLICSIIILSSCNTKKNLITTNETKLNHLHLNLMVDNVQETLDFYKNIGFTILQKVPIQSPQGARVKKDSVSIMFQSTTSLTKEFPQLQQQKKGDL